MNNQYDDDRTRLFFYTIQEAIYPLADNTVMDMHNSAEQTQPHPIIALY